MKKESIKCPVCKKFYTLDPQYKGDQTVCEGCRERARGLAEIPAYERRLGPFI